ncbi:hypothetical protein PENFLA_c005G10011 [Penicillium flavigenum]|uniref:Uncharacterized protein n=1 Tax=Penicillium flavigenum TaxID=254877 RepID=A0A1V6TPE4_9EURO|nr:hypothetical protein PENFLA_c005G10011 [Penicillium flavigenum]
MPTTRQKRKPAEDLLPGLPMDEKRPKRSKGSEASSSRAPKAKPAAKKGKGKQKQDESLPHVALANSLLKRGDALRLPNFPEGSYQTFAPPKEWGHRDVPITNPADIPKGWTSCDLDIAEDDVDSMIERCHRRIDEGIMPVIWEDKLIMYQKMKQRRIDMINSEPPGLSWEVVQRLDSLQMIKKSLDETGDDTGSTPNVIAIMAAYRSGDLVWNDDPGSVTYWAHGKMIAGPKKMEMDEFLAISKEYGHRGVWVEGVDDYKPEPMYLFMCVPPWGLRYSMHMITVSMRNPSTWATNTWEHTMALSVLEDTGAAAMKIYPSDQQFLEDLSGCPLPVTSVTNMSTAAGLVPVRSVVVQVNIFHDDQPMLPRWINVRACIGNDPPSSPSSMRLSGVWLHHMLYCLSMPNNTNTMYVGTDVEEILANAPPCNPAYAIPPPVDPTT